MRRTLLLPPLLLLSACEAGPARAPSDGAGCGAALCVADGGAAGLRLHALATDGRELFAAGASGVLLRIEGGRERWLDTGTPRTLRALALAPDGTLWAAGDAGTVVRLPPGAATRLDAPAAELLQVAADGLVAIGVDEGGLVFVSDGERTFALMNGKLTELDGAARIHAFHRTSKGLFAVNDFGVVRFDGSAFVAVRPPEAPITSVAPGVDALYAVAGAVLYEVGGAGMTAIGHLPDARIVAVRPGPEGLQPIAADGRLLVLQPQGEGAPPPSPDDPAAPGAEVERAMVVGDRVIGLPVRGYVLHDGVRFPAPPAGTLPTAAARAGEELLLFSADAPPMLHRADADRPIGTFGFGRVPAWAFGQADGTVLLGGADSEEVWSFRPETGFVRETRKAFAAIGAHDGGLDWQCASNGRSQDRLAPPAPTTLQRLVFGDEQVEVDAAALGGRCPSLAKQDAEGRWSIWACLDGRGARFELVDDVVVEREQSPACIAHHEVDPTGRLWEQQFDLSGSAWFVDGAYVGDPFGRDTFAGFLADGTPLALRDDERSLAQDLLALRDGEETTLLTELDVLAHWLEPSGALMVATPGTILRVDAR